MEYGARTLLGRGEAVAGLALCCHGPDRTNYLRAFVHITGEEKHWAIIDGAKAGLQDFEFTLHCAWFFRHLASGRHLTELPPFRSTAFEGSSYFITL
jgi:hypothetical protein